MPRSIVIVRGMYVSSGKSAIGPTDSHTAAWLSNTGPKAMPRAGSGNAADAMPPAVRALAEMKRRRVTVSPSNAPGIFASAVVLGFCLRSSGTDTGIYRPRAFDDLLPRAWLRRVNRRPGRGAVATPRAGPRPRPDRPL